MILRALESHRVQQIIRLSAVCSWLVLTVLSLLSGQDRPHTGFSGNVEHAAAYFLSALTTRLGFQWPGAKQLVAFSLASAFFEICQLFIPGRHAGADNWAASSAGAVMGIYAASKIVQMQRATSTRG